MQSVQAPSHIKNRIRPRVILGASLRNLLAGFFFMASFYGYAARANNYFAPAKPAAPSNLIVQVISTTQLDLAWLDNAADEEGYKIERKTGTATVYTQIAIVGPNIVAFSDSGLTQNTKYFYRVRAFNRDGASEYSFAVSGTTLALLPAAPANLSATAVSSSRIDLAWQDNANNETGYRIERKTAQSGSVYQQVAQVAANVTVFASTGINANTKYFYRVRAFNAGGQSDYSNEASTTTLPKAPAAPGNLAATTVSNTKINLTWLDQSTNEDSFKIERGSTGAYKQIAVLRANTKSFADTTLTANTAYFYRVRAFNAGGHSDYSNEAGATTLPDKPAAPGSLTATAVNQGQINLFWQDQATNEDSFLLERKMGLVGKFARIAAVGANVKNFADVGLAEKTEYFYRLCAFNTGGYSNYSNEAGATTLPGPPAAPENLSAMPLSNSRLKLAWHDPASNEDGFKIERKKGAAGAYTSIAVIGPDHQQFADSALAANALYFYRVRAFNVTSHSAYSNEAGATTLTNKPAAPGNLTATAASNKQINLTWQDNSANEDSFKIERKKGAAGEYVQAGVAAANSKSFSDKNLAAGTEYFYRVRAVNAGGHSDYSNSANATTLPDPPVRPGNLTATAAGSSRINLAWTDSSSNETGFRIERRIGAVGIFVEAAKVNANVTSFADTGLAANLKYFYRIRAFNGSGPSAYSTLASAVTLPESPAAPDNFVTVLVTHNRILLAWQDNANNEIGFKLERRTGTGGTFTEIAILNANVTSYTNTGLAETTQYFYRIRAFNNGGPSAYTDLLEVTTAPTPPIPPGSLTATALAHNRIRLAWNDSSRNEAGFTIERKIGLADSFVEVATIEAGLTAYDDGNLKGNTTYLYRIRAFNISGYSNYSNQATATTLLTPPATPAVLTAKTMSSSRINLTWQDKSIDEDSFKIERKVGAAGVYKTTATVRANLQNFSDTGLAGNTEYFYRLRAFNKGGFSEYSNEAGTTTLPLAPAAPRNLFATPMGSNRIDIAWTDSANNEVGFDLERRLNTSTTYTKLTTLTANSNSYSDNQLAANTTYFYRLRAFNAGGVSGYSNETKALTFPEAPNAPENLLASPVSNTQIKLTWNDQAANEDSFRIERSTAGSSQAGSSLVFKQVAVLAADAIQFTDAGLSASAIYFYRLRAVNKGGSSAYSNEASATTLPNPPAAPDNLTATTASSARINLAWQDNSATEDSFKIERKIAVDGVYAEIGRVSANIKAFSDLGLAASTVYFYRVRATNPGGPSAYSNEASATTRPTAPLAPANLVATPASNSQINLVWEDKAANEDSFKIERKLSATGVFKQIAGLGANITSFSDTGLAPNTGYFYRVRAKNNGGASGYSNEAKAVTLPNVPVTPTKLKAVTLNQTQINLTWADSAKNETGFKIERKTVTGDYVQAAAVGANITSYADNALTQDTEYFYRVRAFNAGGHSDYSAEAGAITLPNIPKPPGGLTAITKTSAQIDLVWADSSNNETGFRIERKTGLAGTFAEVGTVAANVTGYSNLGLNANTRYFFRVRAFNRGGQSVYSSATEATTLPKPPAAPGGLTATPLPNFKVDLTWLDNSANEDSFKIERKLGAAGVYVQIGKVAKDVKNYRDDGVQASTPYFYRVCASNTGGHSNYSNETSVTTLVHPPVLPKNLTATTLSSTKIRLAWADSSNDEKGFRIERKTGVSGVFVEILSLGPNVQVAIDSTLKGNTDYFYRIRAFNFGGESNYSNEAGARTLPFPPAKPGSLVAAPFSNTKISLTWLDNSDNEVGFRIERKLSVPETYVQVATLGANATAFTDTALTANTGYYYRIRAFNSGGVSSYSNETTTKTLPNPPAKPQNLTVTTISYRQLNLAWKDSSTNEAGFKIERKTGLNGTYTDIAVVNANVKTFADSTLAGKTAYFYRLRAFNTGGHSEYSNEATATTLPNPPVAPDNLTASLVTNRQVRLIWADNSTNETGFRVERKAATGDFIFVAALKTNITAYADTGLTPLTPYSYRVLAFNLGGNSTYSNQLGVTTLPNPPAKPDSLSATPVSHSRMDLRWRDNSNNESGFYIERKINASGTYVQIAAVGSGLTNYSDTNLAGNKEYFYRVRAFNAGGHSAYATEVKNVTLPIAPGSLIGASVTNRRITLAWTDSSNNESGFRIERRFFETGFVEIGLAGANVDMFADSNLTPNTLYYYRVRAFNLGGVSAYSSETPIATLPNPPAPPRQLSVTPLLNLRMVLAWIDSSHNELGFAIERKLATDAVFMEVGSVNSNETAFIDSTVAAETRYFYRVRAFNSGGNSAYSNEADAITLKRPPAAPSELIATIGGSTRINLIWTDNSDNETGFKIERKFVNDSLYAEIASVGPNVASYASTGLLEGSAYVYRIYAFNDGGASGYSNEVNATPGSDINLAVGKLTGASSTDLSTTTSQAVDGNLNTYWRSATLNLTSPQAWLRVELHPSSLIIIDRVIIRWYQTYFAAEYEIQTSTDGASWTTHYNNETGAVGTQEITFTATPARFVRLYMKRNNKANYRVTEFEVYNGLAKASQPAAANEAIIPETVTLRPNYPNPFNPATTISYALPQATQATLKVLNLAGQEVATLVDRYQERGIYHVTFNARKLPSGVYFAVLQAGDVRQVQRMLLTK